MLLMLVIVAILVVSALAYAATHNSTTGVQEPSGMNSSGPSSTASSSVYASTGSTSVVNTSLGLRLTLQISVNSTGGLSFSLNEYNTLDSPNQVVASDLWVYPESSPSYICGHSAYSPIAYAIFQGQYGPKNFTSATALTLYNTGVAYTCTTIAVAPTSFLFSPLSENATVVFPTGYSSFSRDVLVGASETGYWTGALVSAALHPFVGTYTVLGEDEWGQVVLLQFSVGVPTSSSTGIGTSNTASTSASSNSVMEGVVTGDVTVGAACTAGQSCNENMTAYALVFTPQCSGATTECQPQTAQLNPSGHYSILLPPGTYTVTGLSPNCPWTGCSTAFPQTVTVIGGMQLVFNVEIDAGT